MEDVLQTDPRDMKCEQGGCPIVALSVDDGSGSSQSARHASDTDTDGDYQFSSEVHDLKLPDCPGVAKTHICPVCSEEIFSGLALIRHLKNCHKGVKPYKCKLCDSAFNNLKEKSSHKANVYRPHEVHYKYCEYTTMTKSKMHQYVCKHMKGFYCKTCQCSFQNERLLLVHKKLHQDCQ